MEESTSIALLAGILGLLGKEVIGWLRSRADSGAKALTAGNPHPVVDLSPLEGKVDRVITRLDDLIDMAGQNKKTLAAVAESTDKSARTVARFEESQLRLERTHRERLRQATEEE